MKKFRRENLSVEIFIFNMVVLAVVITVLLGGFLVYFVRVQRKIADDMLETELKNVKNALSVTMDNLEIVSIQLATNPYIVEKLEEYEASDSKNEFDENLEEAPYFFEKGVRGA